MHSCIIPEIQNGPPEWQENDFFLQNVTDDCLFSAVHKFCQNKMATKNDKHTILGKKYNKTAYTLKVKNFVEITLSHTASEILKLFLLIKILMLVNRL